MVQGRGLVGWPLRKKTNVPRTVFTSKRAIVLVVRSRSRPCGPNDCVRKKNRNKRFCYFHIGRVNSTTIIYATLSDVFANLHGFRISACHLLCVFGLKESQNRRFFALKTPIFIPTRRNRSDNAITSVLNWLGFPVWYRLYILLTTFERFGLIRMPI